MDNLRAYKVAGRRERSEERGAPRIYVPPSSADLSPIEPCWSQLKAWLRAAQARTREALEVDIRHEWAAVTSSEVRSWFHHGGDALR